MRPDSSDQVTKEYANFNRPLNKIRTGRIKVAKSVSKKKMIKIMQSYNIMCYLHHNIRRRNYFVFIYVIQLLIGLLRVDYQIKGVSPFDTHPINMWVFYTAACIYCLGLSIKTILRKHHQPNYSQIIISHAILSSGALSSIVLASVFLPCYLGWLCLGSWTILHIMATLRFRNQIYGWLKHSTVKSTSLACEIFNRFRGCLTLKREHLLPM
ncbi:hypothetical protein QYF36_005977 [Acer negundo]|nr:hypothetical protein QYF36_005977 [Acer negundo]